MLYIAKYVPVWPIHNRSRARRVSDVHMHMEHSRCVTHGQKTSSCITCLSCYFPESVCTVVYGIGYSLSLYYLLLPAIHLPLHNAMLRLHDHQSKSCI